MLSKKTEKEINLKLSEIRELRESFPDIRLSEACTARSLGDMKLIYCCKAIFPKANSKDIIAILRAAKLADKLAKVTVASLIVAPLLIKFTMGLVTDTHFMQLVNSMSGPENPLAMLEPSITPMVPQFKDAIEVGTVPTSFFGDKGAILLHMLTAGFFILVVSSFLKFTGRGDWIPLVAFVGGSIILYEIVGLFSDIYAAVFKLMAQ